MLIWHKRLADGRYHMRKNMSLYYDIESLKKTYKSLFFEDMSYLLGNSGLFRAFDSNHEVIGEAYDPDIYRVLGGTGKEFIVPAYIKFYDDNGKFSADVIMNYRKKPVNKPVHGIFFRIKFFFLFYNK